MPSPGLERRDPAGQPRAIVLMLHGGAKAGLDPVGGRSASFRRTSAMRNALQHAGPRRGPLAVAAAVRRARLERRRRARALAGPGRALGPGPGGGRAPRRAGGPARPLDGSPHRGPRRRPPTRRRSRRAGAVARAVRPGATRSTGKHLVAGHGSRDRITSARMTRSYVERAGRVAASARFVDMGRLGHYMLHKPRRVEPLRAARARSRSLDLAVPSLDPTGMPGRPRWLTHAMAAPTSSALDDRRARHPGGRACSCPRRAALRAHRAR